VLEPSLQVVLLAILALRHLVMVVLEFDFHYVLRGLLRELQDLMDLYIIVLYIAQVLANMVTDLINYLQ
jgi:hypothetical protein